MDNLTDLEKLLYNKHLATSRVCANKPFKIKKNFSDIVNTDKHKHLKRLAILFTKHPDIDFNTFFEAPYKLYSDVSYFGLDYFASMRAVKAYTTYKKMLFLQDPDNQVSSVESSLRFIAKYCIEKRIYLHQYPYQKTADLYVWMKHYKENKINIEPSKNPISSKETFTTNTSSNHTKRFFPEESEEITSNSEICEEVTTTTKSM